MRPIFCGNFEYDARQTELERLFKRYGRVERVDMKSGKLMFFPHWLLSLAAREVVEVDMVLMKLTLVTAVFFVVREDVNRTITELLNMIVLENPYSPRLMDGCSEFCSFPVISIFLFSRRVTLIRNGRTMPIFLRHHCLSFLMTFAQPSIPDMFQH
ncbi:hypothetical protein D5086_027559 [Populus alba]|uniref:Uncharacterized protein n=1 Tax=Populus alba TaxID=43335 RepID=A0ACC4AVR6_POPAL